MLSLFTYHTHFTSHPYLAAATKIKEKEAAKVIATEKKEKEEAAIVKAVAMKKKEEAGK